MKRDLRFWWFIIPQLGDSFLYLLDCALPLDIGGFFCLFCFFVFVGLHPRYVEVPRLGVKSELQLPATAIWDLSHVCDLHHSSRQCWLLNPLSEARDQTSVLMDIGQICYHCATVGTPGHCFVLALIHL